MRLPRPGRLFAVACCTSLALTACGSSKASSPTTSAPPTTTGTHVPTVTPKLLARAPSGATKPDDVTILDGKLYVTYQNDAGKDGTPAGSMSTIASFDPATGALGTTWSVLGRCDGLTADPSNHRLLASVNEDNSSSLFVITPGSATPVHYTYSPDPSETGSDGANGGTDAISVGSDGTIYIAHSNPDIMQPAPNNTAAVFTMTLSGTTATLTRMFGVNDSAAVINPGSGAATAALGLTDPDSNRYVASLFGGTLVQDAQADSKLVFAGKKAGDPLKQLNLTNDPATKAGPDVTPQIDDIEQVHGAGTLYVVDQSTYNLFAIPITSAMDGTVFVSQPNPSTGDKANVPALGVVDLTTGVVTHINTSFGSPKGLLFVPAA